MVMWSPTCFAFQLKTRPTFATWSYVMGLFDEHPGKLDTMDTAFDETCRTWGMGCQDLDTIGYVINDHGDSCKSPKDRVVGPLPYMAMNMAYKWGVIY